MNNAIIKMRDEHLLIMAQVYELYFTVRSCVNAKQECLLLHLIHFSTSK